MDVLTLRELSRLDLSDLRHITLSSCWLADHLSLPGRRVISLPEILWRAGAQSVLGCLWLVSDAAGGAFMTRFYGHLGGGAPRDEALRRTQLDFIHERVPECALTEINNPIYWAGFHLFGDADPLRV
jgi:CHAT domain-containing protein